MAGQTIADAGAAATSAPIAHTARLTQLFEVASAFECSVLMCADFLENLRHRLAARK
jgi:hypothetical protein